MTRRGIALCRRGNHSEILSSPDASVILHFGRALYAVTLANFASLRGRDAKSLSSATRKLSEMCLSKSYAKLSEDRFSEIQSEAKLRETSKIGQKFNSSYSITMSVSLFHIKNKRSSNFSEDKFVRLTVKMLPALLNSRSDGELPSLFGT